MKIQTAAL